MSSIMYRDTWQRPIFEGLSARHGIPVLEIARLAREVLMRAIDPINPQGAEFVFRSDAPLNFFSFNPVVPAPDAKVDLWIAWREAQRDARACAEILRHDPSLAMALAIWRNVVAWQRFWAKRWPDPVMRERFAAAVEEFEEEEPVR